jgi:hypothetical protein
MTRGRQVGPPLTANLPSVGPEVAVPRSKPAVRRLQVETCGPLWDWRFLRKACFCQDGALVSLPRSRRASNTKPLERFGKGPDFSGHMGQRGSWPRLQFNAAPQHSPILRSSTRCPILEWNPGIPAKVCAAGSGSFQQKTHGMPPVFSVQPGRLPVVSP